MFDKVLYRRVTNNDILKIQNLFLINFKKKISKEFYINRYYNKNLFNSFVAIYKNNIIGHVGFVKYQYGFDNSIIFSRHSSFVNQKYRGMEIYKNLCRFSYQKLNSKKKYKIITWPNKINILSKPHTKYFYQKEKYCLFKKKFKVNKKDNFFYSKNLLLKNIRNTDRINLLKLSKKNNFLINKNLNYYIFRFKDNYNCKHYYNFFTYNECQSAIIFSKIKFKNYYKVNILNFFGNKINFTFHIKNLIKKISFKKNFIVQIYLPISDRNNIYFLKKNNFVKHNEDFNTIILSNTLIDYNEKKYLKNSLISMSDTDVFIPIN